MQVLVVPRDPNPYQQLLYGQVERLGVRVRYLSGPTRSHTVNLIVMPLVFLLARLRGARVLHLHWMYPFTLPYASRFPVLRLVAQAWFVVLLRTARLVGLHTVWTAHNVLPHGQHFWDDRAARRALVRSTDAVILHSSAAGRRLVDTLGVTPGRTSVIPHGSYLQHYPDTVDRRTARRRLGQREDVFLFVFFGTVAPYKGVDLLLDAFDRLGDVGAGRPLELLVAGRCPDPGYRGVLRSAAASCRGHVTLHLDHVPDDEVQVYLRSADAVVLPFRSVTTSGSAILAMSFGRPVVVPDMEAFDDLPGDACLRYEPTRQGLHAALRQVATASPDTLDRLGAAALRHAHALEWDGIARATVALYRDLVADGGRS